VTFHAPLGNRSTFYLVIVVKEESTIIASAASNIKPFNPKARRDSRPLSIFVKRLSDEVTCGEAAAVEASASTTTTEAAEATLSSLAALAALLTSLLTALLTSLLTALLTALLASLLASLLATLLTTLLAALLSSLLTVVLTIVATIVTTVVTAAATAAANSESHTVILGTTLSDWHDNRLMVGGRGDGADAVDASRETSIKRGSEKTIAITGIVDTLEESKGLSVGRVVTIVANVLDGNMGMANDVASLERLRGGVVGVVRVRERSSLQVVDLHREVDLLVLVLVVVVLGISEDRRDHVADTRNISHDYLKVSNCLFE
jgi:hypothetical protein